MKEFKEWESCVEYEAGDKFTMDAPDRTLWNRFLYWAINRPIPITNQTFVVVDTYGEGE